MTAARFVGIRAVKVGCEIGNWQQTHARAYKDKDARVGERAPVARYRRRHGSISNQLARADSSVCRSCASLALDNRLAGRRAYPMQAPADDDGGGPNLASGPACAPAI
jgi:hypothetical protein